MRSRWAAVGAAVAVTLGGGGLFVASAASSEPSSLIAIEPTRILDTRTDVGLAGPFVPGVSQKLQVTGSVATQPPSPAAPANQVVVPATATSVNMNVTVVAPQTGGFLSIRPGNATGDPATSNINFGAGGPNIANSVSVQLPTGGDIDIYVSGTVGHVLVDVVSYTQPAAGSGDPGPQGDTGATGAQGVDGPRGFSAWDTIPSGQTVTGTILFDSQLIANNADHLIQVVFPGKAPVELTNAQVNFASDTSAVTVDDDPTCTGSSSMPTAPAGKVCIYAVSEFGLESATGNADFVDEQNGFSVTAFANGTSGDMFLNAAWAYTAP